MLQAFLATYAAVFVAEIVGDKLLYTSGVLATRFRWGAVISGMSVAFMAKMAVAVATVPQQVIVGANVNANVTVTNAAPVQFANGADKLDYVVSSAASRGMSRTSVALIVWVAAFLAMVTKGGLAVTLGASVRSWIANHIQPRYVRYGAVAALILLGTLSVLEVMGILVD